MKYTVQRPFTEWAEVVIDEADNIEHALELADKEFEDGNFISVEMSYSLDYDRYWVQDENGNVSMNERELTK